MIISWGVVEADVEADERSFFTLLLLLDVDCELLLVGVVCTTFVATLASELLLLLLLLFKLAPTSCTGVLLLFVVDVVVVVGVVLD